MITRWDEIWLWALFQRVCLIIDASFHVMLEFVSWVKLARDGLVTLKGPRKMKHYDQLFRPIATTSWKLGQFSTRDILPRTFNQLFEVQGTQCEWSNSSSLHKHFSCTDRHDEEDFKSCWRTLGWSCNEQACIFKTSCSRPVSRLPVRSSNAHPCLLYTSPSPRD